MNIKLPLKQLPIKPTSTFIQMSLPSPPLRTQCHTHHAQWQAYDISATPTSLVPVRGFSVIFMERLMTTRGGGGACSAATTTHFMESTTASHLHQLI